MEKPPTSVGEKPPTSVDGKTTHFSGWILTSNLQKHSHELNPTNASWWIIHIGSKVGLEQSTNFRWWDFNSLSKQ
jgi:hypothetical protein